MKKALYFILLVIVLISCDSKEDKDIEIAYDSKIESLFGKHFKQQLYQRASDTLISWVNNNLLSDSVISNSGKPLIWKYKLDSTICINSKGNKLIGTVHQFGLCKDAIDSDDIRQFYGAKIEGKWCFWMGGSMPVIRKAFKNHDPSKPLSYAQLHKEAIESFLGGYLTKDGKINEAWFEFHFEKDGWVQFEEQGKKYDYFLKGKRYANKKKFLEVMYLYRANKTWADKAYQDSLKNLKVNK